MKILSFPGVAQLTYTVKALHHMLHRPGLACLYQKVRSEFSIQTPAPVGTLYDVKLINSG